MIVQMVDGAILKRFLNQTFERCRQRGSRLVETASKTITQRRLAPRPVWDILPVRLRGSFGSRIEEHAQPFVFSS
jgi:hypothetical protein